MAVVAMDGGDERARAREGESREGRRGRERVRERSEGAAWLHPKRPGRSGKQEVAVGGRARAGAPWAHALLPTGRRLKTVGVRRRWAGPRRWAAQGGLGQHR